MISQAQMRRDDQAMARNSEHADTIQREAREIAQQRTAAHLVANLKHVTAVRKAHRTYIDLIRGYRLAQLLVGVGVAVVLAVLAWTALHPDTVEGAGLFIVLASLTGATALAVLGYRRLGSVRMLDQMLPPSIDEQAVEEASRVVGTFGSHRNAGAGSAITTISGIAEGLLVGWIFLSAVAGHLPVVVQVGGALFMALLMVLALAVLGANFRDHVAAIRARKLARHALDLREANSAGAAEEAEWVLTFTKPVTGNDLNRTDRHDLRKAVAYLLGMVALFGLVGLVRVFASPADGSGLSDGLLLATLLLALFFALVGALMNAMGPLRPDEQLKAMVLYDRFPTVAAFRDTKARQERAVELWANGVARRVRAMYRELWTAMDPRLRGPLVEVPEPFAYADPPADVPAPAQPSPTAKTSHHIGRQSGDFYGLFVPKAGGAGTAGGVQ